MSISPPKEVSKSAQITKSRRETYLARKWTFGSNKKLMLLLLSLSWYKYLNKNIQVASCGYWMHVSECSTYKENTWSDSFVSTHAKLDEHYGSKQQKDNHSFHITQLDGLKISNVKLFILRCQKRLSKPPSSPWNFLSSSWSKQIEGTSLEKPNEKQQSWFPSVVFLRLHDKKPHRNKVDKRHQTTRTIRSRNKMHRAGNFCAGRKEKIQSTASRCNH